MSLIEKTKQLAELASYCKPKYEWIARHQSPDGEMEINLQDLRDDLPKMLEVLSQFQLGDEDRLSEVIRKLEDENAWWISDDEMDCLRRMQKMANLTEAIP